MYNVYDALLSLLCCMTIIIFHIENGLISKIYFTFFFFKSLLKKDPLCFFCHFLQQILKR